MKTRTIFLTLVLVFSVPVLTQAQVGNILRNKVGRVVNAGAARAIREISASGRNVLVYKAGRSPEGRSATSSHTASVAGDYGVFKALCEQAGAVVAGDLFEFESFMKGLAWLEGRVVRGRRVGLVSNAGFECVMMADNLKAGAGLDLAVFTAETKERILQSLRPLGIDKLHDIHNPLDVTPVADDAAFMESARAFIEDQQLEFCP